MTTDTGLRVITTPDQYASALTLMREQFNLLTPFASIGGLAPQHAIFTTVVAMNPDRHSGDVYDGVNDQGTNVLRFLKADEVALAKNGLRKVAEGLGISIHLEYPSAGAIRYYWHVKALAAYRGLDGAWVQREASEEWDLRDGSDRLRGWTANQIGEGRKHGLRQCETRAINAVIRECGCGVKQVYKKSELAKPFVAFRVNFVPDMSDQATRQLVTERALQGAATLYAPPASSASQTSGDAFADAPLGEAIPVGHGSTAGASAPTAPEPKADQPPCPGAVKIVGIEVATGEKNGRPWTKWTIVDSRGGRYSTFSKSHRDDADRFQRENAWVEIITEQNGPYVNLVEIVKAQPELDGLASDLAV